eukprot:TRINITY_DN7420_c0_g1_i2.p1 TRINITY_DN7420_c0_g1~~TRINITY_DN7420_c0_g1_i2.p1  ORF type:complete len:632 (+),score=170.11 TRINITY_DN7420_c0_g1_i2:78-1898(+)
MAGLWLRIGLWSCRPSDSDADRERKLLFAPAMWLIGFATSVWGTSDMVSQHIAADSFAALCSGAICLCGAGALRWTAASAFTVCRFVLLAGSVLVVVVDAGAASMMTSRAWPWFTVIIVSARLLALDDCSIHAILVVVFCWVMLEMVDRAHQLGVLDSAQLFQNRTLSACACPDPPCVTPMPASVVWVTARLTVIGVVHSLSRTFSVNVATQLNLVKASVLVTQHVTVALSRYEVDTAEAAVNSSEGEKLPPDLRESLVVLLQNLKGYKAYLPQSCLMQGAVEPESDESDPESRMSAGTHLRDRPSALSDRVGTDSDRDSPTAAGRAALPTVVSTKVGPKAKRLSLLCCCREDFLSFVRGAGVSEIERSLAREVETFSAGVTDSGGVVDLVNGERGFASFNASRQCSRHAHKAVLAMESVKRRRSAAGSPTEMVRFAAASGSAICGDFGSTTMQRFMVLGRISSVLLVIEKLSAEWKLHSAVNDAVYEDTRTHWQHTPAGAWFMVKLGPQSMNRVYEVGEQIADHHEEEWMYQLAALETPEDHVAKWLDQVAAGAFDPAEQMLDTHFGRQSVVVVSEIGLTCHRVWRLDAQTCLATSICPSAKEDT